MFRWFSLGFHQVSWLRNCGSTDPHHPRPASPGPGALLPRAREVAAGPRGDVAGGEETPPGRGRWLWKMGLKDGYGKSHGTSHGTSHGKSMKNQWKSMEHLWKINEHQIILVHQRTKWSIFSIANCWFTRGWIILPLWNHGEFSMCNNHWLGSDWWWLN